MAASTGYRTLYPSIVPPGAAHIDGVISGSNLDSRQTMSVGAVASSFLADFVVRAMGVQNIHATKFELLPRLPESNLLGEVVRLYLRLNCLTTAYAPLWQELTGEPWTKDLPLRRSIERRAAQIEIDAIVALSLGITADELCMIYRTQFPVMRRYDLEDHFDRNGRKVSKEVIALQKKLQEGQELTQEQRTWIHPQSGVTYVFEYPFRVLDREKDLRTAYLKYQGALPDD